MDLPLIRFIRCMCDDDYSPLIIEGEASSDQLLEMWQQIYEEYLDMTGAHRNNYALTLTAEINELFFRHVSIVEGVNILRKHRFDDLVAMMHKSGYRFPFNPLDPAKYQQDLDRVINRAKTLLVDIENKQAQLKALRKGDDGEKISRLYFDKLLAMLSKFQGYRIDKEVTTVSEYVSILNLYIQHCDQLKAQNGRGQNK